MEEKSNVKGIVTGNPDFRNLVTNNNIYVDKTMYLHSLVTSPDNFFFISRPRRFGKSTVCKTLKELFSGHRELFEGLYISRTGYDFQRYPVLSFSFSKLNNSALPSFLKDFKRQIAAGAKENGIEVPSDEKPSAMMDILISSLDKPPVIIIDEFDSPIIDAASRKAATLAEEMRIEFNAFYKVLKDHDGDIRFFFLTGCTKLSGLNIFSAMNNLNDITLSGMYAGMFGYTQQELEEYFAPYIDKYLAREEREYRTREEFLSAFRDHYDGYRFSHKSDVQVYNPVSVGKFFSPENDFSFEEFWTKTGLSTLAVTVARRADITSLLKSPQKIGVKALDVFDITRLLEPSISVVTALTLLYFAGYLTIVGRESSNILLYYPDEEVKSSFSTDLLSSYMRGCDDVSDIVTDFRDSSLIGDVEGILKCTDRAAGRTDYQHFTGRKHDLYQFVLFSLSDASGAQYASIEFHGKLGRADLVFRRGEFIYIFEVKVNGRAELAMEQIHKKEYYRRFFEEARREGLRIIACGVVFDSAKRCVKESITEEITLL